MGSFLAELLAEVMRCPIMMMAAGTIIIIVTAEVTIITMLQGVNRYLSH
jgi:hypothetical protein